MFVALSDKLIYLQLLRNPKRAAFRSKYNDYYIEKCVENLLSDQTVVQRLHRKIRNALIVSRWSCECDYDVLIITFWADAHRGAQLQRTESASSLKVAQGGIALMCLPQQHTSYTRQIITSPEGLQPQCRILTSWLSAFYNYAENVYLTIA